MCVYEVVLINILVLQLGPPKQKFLAPPLVGEVKVTLAEKIRKPPTVEVLELLAARRAALFSEDLGLDKVIFEGDSE